MSANAPQVLARRPHGTSQASSQTNETSKGRSSGNRPASRGGKDRTAADRKANNDTPKSSKPRPQNEGEKLVIRRLPPGMTEAEFVAILGAEWELGKGKVDWLSFAQGKISNDAAKPSRPGRAYIRVTKKDSILALSEVVRLATWEDAKVTFNSPSLIAPPSVEYAIYKKVPNAKKRTDTRQGTIDQDPEFMSFLEELANPESARDTAEPSEGEEASKSGVKVSSTPLIDFLKEKRAAKASKESSSKGAKHGRQEKGKGVAKDDEPSKKKGRDSKPDKDSGPKKETVKILTKKAATEQVSDAGKNAPAKESSTSSADAPKSRRAGIAAAARLLQRDLGLSPGSAHRRARQDAAKADAGIKATPAKEAAIKPGGTPTPSPDDATAQNRAATPSSGKSQASPRKARGAKNADKNKPTESAAPSTTPVTTPVIMKKKGGPAPAGATTEATTSTSSPDTTLGGNTKGAANGSASSKAASGKAASKKAPAITAGATRGFVKHANASQGINEDNLKQVLEPFGSVASVEMDKRKGFAYVDFAEHGGLVKASAAGPITIGQGTVQVMERRDKKPAASSPSGNGGGSGGTGASGTEKSSNRGRRARGKGAVASTNGQAVAAAGTASTTENGGAG